jgi:hypothetical protein
MCLYSKANIVSFSFSLRLNDEQNIKHVLWAWVNLRPGPQVQRHVRWDERNVKIFRNDSKQGEREEQPKNGCLELRGKDANLVLSE